MRSEGIVGRRLDQVFEILDSYGRVYPIPFTTHLARYFNAHKTLGGKDRKEIRAWCFAFLRVAPAVKEFEEDPAMALALQATGTITPLSNKVIERLPASGAITKLDIAKAIPLGHQVSREIDKEAFATNLLKQQAVWGWHPAGKNYKLEMPHFRCQDGTIKFEADADLEDEGGRLVLQDWASVRATELIGALPGERWWDACAGAGGKTMGLLRHTPKAKVWASDIRETIVRNLKTRLKKHGFDGVKIALLDAQTAQTPPNFTPFDGIVADVPCSGSGTWARSPENLSLFKQGKLDAYVRKQRELLSNLPNFLKLNGTLVYITCSIYKAENEDAMTFAQEELGMELLSQQYIKGYPYRAETMFVSRLKKIS